MNKQEIIVILNDIFAEVFEDKSISINEDSNSIFGMGSLTLFVVKKFELNFTASKFKSQFCIIIY